MKLSKKVLAFLLALCMLCGIPLSVSAATNIKIFSASRISDTEVLCVLQTDNGYYQQVDETSLSALPYLCIRDENGTVVDKDEYPMEETGSGSYTWKATNMINQNVNGNYVRITFESVKTAEQTLASLNAKYGTTFKLSLLFEDEISSTKNSVTCTASNIVGDLKNPVTIVSATETADDTLSVVFSENINGGKLSSILNNQELWLRITVNDRYFAWNTPYPMDGVTAQGQIQWKAISTSVDGVNSPAKTMDVRFADGTIRQAQQYLSDYAAQYPDVDFRLSLHLVDKVSGKNGLINGLTSNATGIPMPAKDIGGDVVSVQITSGLTFESAKVVEITENDVTTELVFSSPIWLNQDHVHMSKKALSGGCGSTIDSDHWMEWKSDSLVPAEGILTNGGKTYASVWRVTFKKCCDVHKPLWGTEGAYTVAEGVIAISDQGAATNSSTAYVESSCAEGFAGLMLKVTNKLNNQYEVAAATMMAAPLDAGDPITTIEDGQAYSFMNCDTGRKITVNGVDAFVLSASGDGNAYTVDTAIADANTITIKACANERYQIIVNENYVLTDNDANMNNEANLIRAFTDQASIESCWYMTKAGDVEPLKVMPLGDSLTHGVTSTVTDDVEVGYREKLSEKLTEYFGRVVFVGEKVTAKTTADETRLLRHAGYPGYTIKYVWPENDALENGNNATLHQGVADFIEGQIDKYTPDIVCMMLGTNDLSQIQKSEAKSDEEQMADLIANYTSLVMDIEAKLDDNGLLICSAITPNKYAFDKTYTQPFAEQVIELVDEWRAEGKKIASADQYSAVLAVLDVENPWDDGVHLNNAGYAAMADEYYRVIVNNYKANSNKFNGLQDALNTAVSGTVVSLTGSMTVADEGLLIPDGVTLDLKGYELAVSTLVANIGESNLIDSTDGEGLIVIARDQLALGEKNQQLPLYDINNGGYRLFNCEITHQMKELESEGKKELKFGSMLSLNERALELLKDPTAAGVTMRMDIPMVVNGETKTLVYDFKPATIAKYAEMMLDNPEGKTWAIVLTVYGIEKLESDITLSASPILRTSTTTVKTGSPCSYEFKSSEGE